MDPITIVLTGDSDEAQRLGARDFLNTSQPTILTWMTVDNSIEVRLTVTPLPFPGVPCQQIWKYDIGASAPTPRNTLESSDFLSNVRTEAQNVADRLYQPAHWSFEAQPIATYDANVGTSRSERPSRMRRAPHAGPQTTSPPQRQELDTLQACDRPSSVRTRPAPACDEQKMPAKDLWQLAEGLDAWAREAEVQSFLADLLCSAALKAASQKYRNSPGSGKEMNSCQRQRRHRLKKWFEVLVTIVNQLSIIEGAKAFNILGALSLGMNNTRRCHHAWFHSFEKGTMDPMIGAVFLHGIELTPLHSYPG